jgi:uncharacterized membrane protein YdbT with pleckstrin-like domain
MEKVLTLPLNVYQKLGVKTFWLSLSERLSVAMGFFLMGAAATIALRLPIVPPELRPMIGLAGVVFFAIFFLAFLIAFFISWLVYKNHLFCLSDDAFKIKSGVFTKVEMAIPYRQIQNVEIERKLSFQILGLSRLLIITAGHDNPATERDESEGVLPMIEKEIASALQEELLKRSDIQRTTETK